MDLNQDGFGRFRGVTRIIGAGRYQLQGDISLGVARLIDPGGDRKEETESYWGVCRPTSGWMDLQLKGRYQNYIFRKKVSWALPDL